MKAKTQKGFTLAELLIVMAIIVVLAAVAVPTFGRQLETARETGDMELIRNAYTEALSLAIIDGSDGSLDGKKGTSSSLETTGVAISAASDVATYTMTLDGKIRGNGSFTFVNNAIGDKSVTATTGHTKAVFEFAFDSNSGAVILNSNVTTAT